MAVPNTPRRSIFAVWRWPWWAWLATLPLLLVAFTLAYLSAYSMCVVREFSCSFEHLQVTVFAAPAYSCEAYFPPPWKMKVRRFFRPAHQLDLRIRPEKWKPQTKEFSDVDEEQTFVVKGDRGKNYIVKFAGPFSKFTSRASIRPVNP